MDKQRPFFKGILGFTRQDDEVLARDAEEGIYRWWWEFMRLSPVFWYARTRGIEPTDPKIAETYRLLGDLSHGRFREWWNTTGRYVFAEVKRPQTVELLDLNNLEKHAFKEKALYLELPLTIRKETILKKVKQLLNEHHDGRSLDLAGTTTAKLKLHTKRYRLRVIETEFWVLLYRMLYPKIENWRIGDRLQLSPHLKVRTAERLAEPLMFDQVSSVTGRYLYKAKFTLNNLLFGNFPNVTKLSLDNSFMPFGERHHQDYLAATNLSETDDKSEFHQWLIDEFDLLLKYEVIRRNHLTDLYRMISSKVRARMPMFLSGESDLIS